MKKNNKGFTLIELLAVIVVLAVIMVIATTQINRTIKKSRANTFYDSVLMIEKHAKMVCAQDNILTESALDEITDYNKGEYTFSVSDDGKTVTVTPTAGGKFDNVDFNAYYSTAGGNGTEKLKSSISINKTGASGSEKYSMTISNPCTDTTTTS